MTFRSILVPVDGSECSKAPLDAAITLAQELGAHVNALHVKSDPKDAVPLLGEGMSASIIEKMIQMAETESAENAAKAKAMFEDACDRLSINVAEMPTQAGGASAAFMTTMGREDEAVALKGRLSDLTVISRPYGPSEASTSLTINAALFETGRPVLVIPPENGSSLRLDGKVAVSWNGSAEASRAVAAAMPLISRSSGVQVLTAESGSSSPDIAAELAAYFAWHGVEATTRELEATGVQVGSAVLQSAKTGDAGLLIMGAYTHSRMRQLILGGVTRFILEEADIPVLMAH